MVADDCNVGPRGGGTEKDTPAVMALRKPQTGEKTLWHQASLDEVSSLKPQDKRLYHAGFPKRILSAVHLFGRKRDWGQEGFGNSGINLFRAVSSQQDFSCKMLVRDALRYVCVGGGSGQQFLSLFKHRSGPASHLFYFPQCISWI